MAKTKQKNKNLGTDILYRIIMAEWHTRWSKEPVFLWVQIPPWIPTAA